MEKAILKPIQRESKVFIKKFGETSHNPVVVCCEDSMKQYEGVNVDIDNISTFLDNLSKVTTCVEFFYCDMSSRSKLVKMLMNRKIGYVEY